MIGRFLEKPPAQAYHQAYKILRNREDAAEAVAQAVCQAWEHAGARRGEACLTAWFVAITRNVALMELRRRRWAEERSPEVARRLPEVATPEALVLARERRRRLARAITSLPDTYRTTVRLVYGEGLTLADAGRRLGISEDCCRSRLYRARRILVEKLGVSRRMAARESSGNRAALMIT